MNLWAWLKNWFVIPTKSPPPLPQAPVKRSSYERPHLDAWIHNLEDRQKEIQMRQVRLETEAILRDRWSAVNDK